MKKAAAVLLVSWLVLSALYGASKPSLGGDLWWSLAAGRYISEIGAVPNVDVFSHTAEGLPWYNQEWLTQIFYWKLFDTLGPDGLVYVKLALGVLFTLLLARLGTKRSGSAFLGISTAAAVLLLWGYHVDLRAQFFTFLGTVVLLSVIDAYRRGIRWAAFGPPLVLLLWVDLHYGFIFGLAIVFGYFGAETAKSLLQLPANPMPLARSLKLGWIFLASVVACAINPQGLDALLFPFDILDASSPWDRVIEWRPPRLFRTGWPDKFVFVLAAQVLVAGLAFWRAPRRFDLADFGLVAVVTIMAFTSRRFIVLFGIVSAPFFARNIANLAREYTARTPALHDLYRQYGTAAAALVGLAGTLWVGTAFWTHANTLVAGGLFDRMTHAERFPVNAARFLQKNPIPGKIYNFYPWGGYLIFQLDRQIYIDGRAHAVYPDEMYYEARRTDDIRIGWRKTLAKRGIDVVVHQSHYPVPLKLRTNPGWVRVYDDGFAAVVVRKNEATAPFLEQFRERTLWYPDTPGADLFLAELQNRAGKREDAIGAMVEALETHGAAAEEAAFNKREVEKVALEFIPDAKAGGTAESIDVALYRYYEAHPEAAAMPAGD
ncbi:MAG: hypothetical protein P8R42_14895 [Candidatus Binatia bacterium]|nr:hypothetical protein [Candidatus Binatia bacterium]